MSEQLQLEKERTRISGERNNRFPVEQQMQQINYASDCACQIQEATTATATNRTSRRQWHDERCRSTRSMMPRSAISQVTVPEQQPPSLSRQRRHGPEQGVEQAFIPRPPKTTRSLGTAQLRLESTTTTTTTTTNDDDDEPQNSRLGLSWSDTTRANSSRRLHRQCHQSEVGKLSKSDLVGANKPFSSRRSTLRTMPLQVCLGKLSLTVFCLCLASFLLLQLEYVETKSIDESAPTNGRPDTRIGSISEVPGERQDEQQYRKQPTININQVATSGAVHYREEPISTLGIKLIIEQATTVSNLIDSSRSTVPLETDENKTTLKPIASTKREANTPTSLIKEADITTTSTTGLTTETTTTTTTTESTVDNEDDASGAESDDNNAESCEGLSSGPSTPGEGPTDNERLVNLQTCLQKKITAQLRANARSSMEVFHSLSLSGACSASLMNLMSSLGALKGFAFKFLDASAKIPSGMMSGLLSDFGDFEQCLAIRSSAQVDPSLEAEEGGYSGKYCLLNIRMLYRVKLGPNSTVPEGIYPDGVLWDELVRNYWTTNSSKGFQVGVCLPSRCDHDDLNQLITLFAERFHVHGEVSTCQDSNDVRRQQEPDLVQLIIIYSFLTILALNLVGTYADRYVVETELAEIRSDRNKQQELSLLLKIFVCFSIRRNWFIFLHSRGGQSMGGPDGEPLSPSSGVNSSRRHKSRSSVSLTTSDELNTNGAVINSTICSSGNSSSYCSSSSPSGIALNGSICQDLKHYEMLVNNKDVKPIFQPLSVRILPESVAIKSRQLELAAKQLILSKNPSLSDTHSIEPQANGLVLNHLWGLKLLVIIWITVGHSFLYPSANNYQHYRSIINMNITRNSVWFATTNFILGIDMLLYITGLMFVLKLAQLTTGQGVAGSLSLANDQQAASRKPPISIKIVRLISTKVLRFWPTYLSVIAIAIVAPLISNGPMWPEMVSRRLGETCRANWWANLLMINNLLDSSRVCLPASWFISVTMQCFLVGSAIVALANRHSTRLAVTAACFLICLSSSISFWLAYSNKLNAPAIRMDESFVMELDENIFRMYTSTINNLGPFLVGMLGGFLLLTYQQNNHKSTSCDQLASPKNDHDKKCSPKIEKLSRLMFELNLAFAMTLIGMIVLSSVFFTNYTPIWSAVYWSGHRVGWAIVTGYLIHQCTTGKWRLVRDLLSLSTFVPLGRLIFIAYLVHPMFIHIHSGLVRDGLHVSLYNMLNIYITRLVMTFSLALCLHLLVELPFCSMEETLLNVWLERRKKFRLRRQGQLERGQSSKGSKVMDCGQQQTGERVSGEPLLRVASVDRINCARALFERQETTETTLGENG